MPIVVAHEADPTLAGQAAILAGQSKAAREDAQAQAAVSSRMAEIQAQYDRQNQAAEFQAQRDQAQAERANAMDVQNFKQQQTIMGQQQSFTQARDQQAQEEFDQRQQVKEEQDRVSSFLKMNPMQKDGFRKTLSPADQQEWALQEQKLREVDTNPRFTPADRASMHRQIDLRRSGFQPQQPADPMDEIKQYIVPGKMNGVKGHYSKTRDGGWEFKADERPVKPDAGKILTDLIKANTKTIFDPNAGELDAEGKRTGAMVEQTPDHNEMMKRAREIVAFDMQMASGGEAVRMPDGKLIQAKDADEVDALRQQGGKTDSDLAKMDTAQAPVAPQEAPAQVQAPQDTAVQGGGPPGTPGNMDTSGPGGNEYSGAQTAPPSPQVRAQQAFAAKDFPGLASAYLGNLPPLDDGVIAKANSHFKDQLDKGVESGALTKDEAANARTIFATQMKVKVRTDLAALMQQFGSYRKLSAADKRRAEAMYALTKKWK